MLSRRYLDMDTWVLPTIDLQLCTGCGRCVGHCPEGAIVMASAGPAFVRPQACTYCGICETVCPEGAVSLAYTIAWAPDKGG